MVQSGKVFYRAALERKLQDRLICFLKRLQFDIKSDIIHCENIYKRCSHGC